jgi:hypothetical protein
MANLADDLAFTALPVGVATRSLSNSVSNCIDVSYLYTLDLLDQPETDGVTQQRVGCYQGVEEHH